MATHRLLLLPGRLAVCRLPAEAPLPAGVLDAPFAAVTRTGDELSVVVPEARVDPSWHAEAGWRTLKVEGPLAFEMVGVIASLSAPLAEAGIPVFLISTFDTDYLLVKHDRLEQTRGVLQARGHTVVEPGHPAP